MNSTISLRGNAPEAGMWVSAEGVCVVSVSVSSAGTVTSAWCLARGFVSDRSEGGRFPSSSGGGGANMKKKTDVLVRQHKEKAIGPAHTDRKMLTQKGGLGEERRDWRCGRFSTRSESRQKKGMEWCGAVLFAIYADNTDTSGMILVHFHREFNARGYSRMSEEEYF
jgi:hypothetical protein